MKNIIISPSVLSADFADLGNEVKRLELSGADWVHIDVMDGHFVPNITIGAPVVRAINKISDIPLDVHLMIENPEKYIDDFSAAGADIITVHYEAVKRDVVSVINQIKKSGIKAGLSIKPKTQPDEIREYIPLLDLVLVMTVEPGFGGQKFMKDCADKIKQIKEYSKNDNLIIEVDGGINAETALYCKNSGANALVAGSYIFSSSDIKNAIKSLR